MARRRARDAERHALTARVHRPDLAGAGVDQHGRAVGGADHQPDARASVTSASASGKSSVARRAVDDDLGAPVHLVEAANVTPSPPQLGESRLADGTLGQRSPPTSSEASMNATDTVPVDDRHGVVEEGEGMASGSRGCPGRRRRTASAAARAEASTTPVRRPPPVRPR